IHNPVDMPDPMRIEEIQEPWIEATILTPDDYLGSVLKLCQDRRGAQKELTYVGSRAMVKYELPLNEVVFDFYDRLKSVSKGYASFDYRLTDFKPADLVKMQILVNGDPVDALAMLVHRACAEAYPSRNVTMIVPFPPGGQADLAARPVALKLQDLLGKPFIIDNRAGAGGATGNAVAARAEPDGHTLLMTLSSLAVLPEADRLFDRPVAYEVSQFAPVARVLADPTLLAVPDAAPWKTLQDFVDDAKKRPGQIPYGSSGPYGTLHVAMEMFAASAGIKLLHVPFRGAGPALTAL